MGWAELDVTAETGTGQEGRRRQRVAQWEIGEPALLAEEPDLDALAEAGRDDLLAGEAQLEQRAATAVNRGLVSVVAGWVPCRTPELAERLQPSVPRSSPAVSTEAPIRRSLLHTRGRPNQPFAPLVDTYTTVPYVNVDPTAVAGWRLIFSVRDDVR